MQVFVAVRFARPITTNDASTLSVDDQRRLETWLRGQDLGDGTWYASKSPSSMNEEEPEVECVITGEKTDCHAMMFVAARAHAV